MLILAVKGWQIPFFLGVPSKRSEEEVSKLKTRISSKDEEFTRTAESLSKELSSLQDQLQQQQADRDRILKDKESLLEEVGLGF